MRKVKIQFLGSEEGFTFFEALPNDPHLIFFFGFFFSVTLGYEEILKVREFEHFRSYGPKIAHTFKEGGADLTPPPPCSKGLRNPFHFASFKISRFLGKRKFVTRFKKQKILFKIVNEILLLKEAFSKRLLHLIKMGVFVMGYKKPQKPLCA